MPPSVSHLQAIGLAIAGFTLWVLTDTAMKFTGSYPLPPAEVVAFLGFSIAAFLAVYALARGETRQLWPKRPGQQVEEKTRFGT